MSTSMKKIAVVATLFGMLAAGTARAQEQSPADMESHMEKMPPMCKIFQDSLRESPGFALLVQGSPHLTHNADAFKGIVSAACPGMDWSQVANLSGLTKDETKNFAEMTCNNIHGLAEGIHPEFDALVHNVSGNHETFMKTCGWAFGEGGGHDGEHQHNPDHHMPRMGPSR
ncbi:MAG: hypothetical protein HY370_09075 [Proteobacteria bacterium]|nr:hypothetical protein [Pseudomonadota bacterium]